MDGLEKEDGKWGLKNEENPQVPGLRPSKGILTDHGAGNSSLSSELNNEIATQKDISIDIKHRIRQLNDRVVTLEITLATIAEKVDSSLKCMTEIQGALQGSVTNKQSTVEWYNMLHDETWVGLCVSLFQFDVAIQLSE